MDFNESVWQKQSTKAAALATIFNLAVVGQMNPTNIAVIALAGTSVFVTMTTFHQFSDWVDTLRFKGNKETLCIDTMPTPSTPPTSLDNLKASKDIRFRSAGYGALASLHVLYAGLVGLTAAYYVRDTTFPMKIVGAYAGASTAISMILAHWGFSYNRFNKVVKGTWSITDTPEPQKQEEKAPATPLMEPV